MKKQSEKRSTFDVQRSTLNGAADGADSNRETGFDLEERLLSFAARIIRVVDALPPTRAGNHIAGQLIRCGTSPLPNHGEAQAAESRADFVHKMRVCLKELRETRRWLRLIVEASLIRPNKKVLPILAETTELIRIFYSSVRTAKAQSGSRVKEEPPNDIAPSTEHFTYTAKANGTRPVKSKSGKAPVKTTVGVEIPAPLEVERRTLNVERPTQKRRPPANR